MKAQKDAFRSVDGELYLVLLRQAVEVGPRVELNDLLACDKIDVMDQIHRINLTTQVVYGSQDNLTPVK